MPRPFLVPDRRNDPELMDAPGLPEAEVADAYRVLRRVNRHLGNNRAIDREIGKFLSEDRLGPVLSALDVGSGSGDIPNRIAGLIDRLGFGPVVPIALDHDPTASALAGSEGGPLAVVRGDRSIDLVTAVKFAHHFDGGPLARLLSEMARVARHRVVVLDIRRHWLAYWGFVAWSRAFTRNRLVRYDGPLSVLRGFTDDELADLAAPINTFRWTPRRTLTLGHRPPAAQHDCPAGSLVVEKPSPSRASPQRPSIEARSISEGRTRA
jgi:SAM-dependent methyltransferase